MKLGWLLVLLGGVSLAGAQVRITGRVVDENQVAVEGAQVSVGDRSAVSDPTGSFLLQFDTPGEYRLNAQREGFFLLRERPVRLDPGDNVVTVELNHQREVLDSIEVSYSPPAVNPEETVAAQELLGTQLLGVPFPSTNNLRNAMTMLPGIVQDAKGNIHIHGSGTDQTFWTLDGFNVTDPLTGRFDSRLSVDGIQAIEVASSRYSAETGKGSGGSVQIRTGMGDDRWRPSATNFFPGIENHKGLTIGNWTPRATFSGPLRRGRAWLSNAIETRYDNTVVEELPKGEDRSISWRASNLLRLQVNLTPSNIFIASWLVNYANAPRNGLTVLDPVETTVDRRSRLNFVSVKDQIYLGGGALVELGYAASRGFAREIPQGRERYTFTPEGRRGNYYLDSLRQSGRDQWLANVFLPTLNAAGSHQLKAGIDLDRVTFYQWSQRNGFEFYRTDGTRSRRIDFFGDSRLRRKNFEAASYVQDRWKLRPNLLVEMGTRVDWDQIVRRPVMSPRVSVSLAVPGRENTKVAAGYGLFHDATNLRVLSRHLDQYALAHYYAPDGRTVRHGPSATAYLLDDRDLRVPVSRNLSLGVEHLFPLGVHGRFEYLRKRGREGFTFVNTVLPGVPTPPDVLAAYEARSADGLFTLRNPRWDIYDSFEVTVRKNFRRQSEFLVSYTRSRAVSNAVVDVNIDDPIIVDENNIGRLPWDTPNRFLGWGIVTLSEKNSIAYLAEWRDGFPFNVVDDEGRLQGKVTEFRYPSHFSLNLHWERKFTFGRYRWAWRGGFNNLTNRLNPTFVNNNASSPRFMQFSGGQRRAFVMRIRWLGKK